MLKLSTNEIRDYYYSLENRGYVQIEDYLFYSAKREDELQYLTQEILAEALEDVDRTLELFDNLDLANENLNERDRLIIKMLMELGVRVSELTNLTLDNIDILGQQIDIYGKGSKIRTLPIKRDLADDIRNYVSSSRKDNKHATSKYLFVSERSPKLHRNTILELEVVKQMGEDLG